MANPNPQFRVVEDEEQSQAQSAAAQTILLALTALSQRAIVSLASLYSVALIGSVWSVSHHPAIRMCSSSWVWQPMGHWFFAVM